TPPFYYYTKADAARIQEAQRAEREMVERLAGLRHEEDALRRMREEKVAEHVRAQLALRALNSQNGEPVMAARKAEAEARLAMDKARDAFEMASRARAATERELGRIRDEVQRARDIASQGRYGQWAQAVPLLPDVPDGTLYAPVSGLVLAGSARPGQTVGSGDPILLIAPEGTGERHPYWLQAFFPEEAAKAIHTGQACKVRFTASDGSLSAHVAEVGAPGPMPAGGPVDSGQSSVTGRFVPVRITLEDALPQGVRPGSAAKCTVATHSLFGFSALF
ncbi:MAG: HlyD family efflux transporter periplasmic adaptor subunit, partial [Desulfovibrionaceae bacterium]|nr:HlyD family efflux transporter periplasmic adaptor subunit [Desulfovibrionaceae bacterium]